MELTLVCYGGFKSLVLGGFIVGNVFFEIRDKFVLTTRDKSVTIKNKEGDKTDSPPESAER